MLLEGHAVSDHVHLCLSIPPKYSVSYAVGFLKGKSAVQIHREVLHERRMSGLHFWTTGYWVSTWDETRLRCVSTFGRRKTGIVNKGSCLINHYH